MLDVKANIKEVVGYVEEEVGEIIASEEIAKKGRRLRNEGRIYQGKSPMLTKPGTLRDNNTNV